MQLMCYSSLLCELFKEGHQGIHTVLQFPLAASEHAREVIVISMSTGHIRDVCSSGFSLSEVFEVRSGHAGSV